MVVAGSQTTEGVPVNRWSFVALLLAGAMFLGATVFGEPIARAAQGVSATIVGPLDADGNVMVRAAPPAPISTGGNDVARSCADAATFASEQVATALSIHMEAGIAEVVLEHPLVEPAARFAGPAAAGNGDIVLALTRPVAFSRIRCIGTGNFSVSWVGNSP
jgi:hypothetical protein